MVHLIECLVDGGRVTHAAAAAGQAAAFVKKNNPAMFKTVFGLQVIHAQLASYKIRRILHVLFEMSSTGIGHPSACLFVCLFVCLTWGTKQGTKRLIFIDPPRRAASLALSVSVRFQVLLLLLSKL